MVVVILRLRASLVRAHVSRAPWSAAPLFVFAVVVLWAVSATLADLGPVARPGADDGTTLLATRGVEIAVIALSGAVLLPRPPWRLDLADLRRFSVPRHHLLWAQALAGCGHPLVMIVGLSAVACPFWIDTSCTTMSVAAACCAWANFGTLMGVLHAFIGRAGWWGRSATAVVAVGALTLFCAMSGVLRVMLPHSLDAATTFAELSPFGAPWVAILQPTTGPFLPLSVGYLVVLLGLLALLAGPALGYPTGRRSPRRHRSVWAPRPGSPLGAIAWRQAVYACRDGRRFGEALAGLCIVAIATLFAAITADVASAGRVFVLALVLLVSTASHNSSALDRTTLWPDVLAGVTGAADRVGRMIPSAVVGSLVAIVGPVIVAMCTGVGRTTTVEFAMICLSLLASGLSVATVLDVLLSYPPRSDETKGSRDPQVIREVAANILALALPLACVSPSVAEAFTGTPNSGMAAENLAACMLLLGVSVLVSAGIRQRTIIGWFEQAQAGTYRIFRPGVSGAADGRHEPQIRRPTRA